LHFGWHPSVKFDGSANYFSLLVPNAAGANGPGAIDVNTGLNGLTIAAVLSTRVSGVGKLVLGRAYLPSKPSPPTVYAGFGFGLNATLNDGKFGFWFVSIDPTTGKTTGIAQALSNMPVNDMHC
jgi:hypothetical protein